MGVYHGLRRRHVQRHLDGSVFRWNRRRHRRTSLDSLPGIGLGLPPATYRDLADVHASVYSRRGSSDRPPAQHPAVP